MNNHSNKGLLIPFKELLIMNNRPDIITIFAQVSANKKLVDQRLNRNFAFFGDILRVAKQYGIQYKEVSGGIQFSAPKSRMQIFVEKLHFSQIRYIEI